MVSKLKPLLLEVYQRLLSRYGPQGWWPGEGPLEVIIGAILTQSANWANVAQAIENLKRSHALEPQAIRELPSEELGQLIRPSGYFNAKARKLKAFMEHLGTRYQDNLACFLAQEPGQLRQELLSIYGIGEETADDILLYAAGAPVFVVDAYTRRILARLGLLDGTQPYRAFQQVLVENLPQEVSLFNEYHALLVRHGKERCRRFPHCSECPLLELCPTGQDKFTASVHGQGRPIHRQGPSVYIKRRGKGLPSRPRGGLL